jgi:transcriptional regulator with XRE-family HTH domain
VDDSVRRTELAKFLRAKRAAITPDVYGLPKSTRRRTPGLRREEVALRANIGVAWYTWLEQGRDIHVSRDVVNRIAVALNLSTSDRSYLASLAAQQTSIPDKVGEEPITEALDLLNGFSAGPAMLWNARFDCIAYNHLADVIYEWSDSPEPFGLNVIWRFFMDTKRQELYSGAEHLVHDCVGMLRARYASQIGEPDFEALVKVLLSQSESFAVLWARQRTAPIEPVPFVLTHPTYGKLALRSVRALFPPISGSTLVFGIPTDNSTKAVFKRLSAG